MDEERSVPFTRMDLSQDHHRRVAGDVVPSENQHTNELLPIHDPCRQPTPIQPKTTASIVDTSSSMNTDTVHPRVLNRSLSGSTVISHQERDTPTMNTDRYKDAPTGTDKTSTSTDDCADYHYNERNEISPEGINRAIASQEV